MSHPGYDRYLRSSHWKRFRDGYWRRHERRCWVCDATPKRLHLHHRDYACVGRERDDDVVPVCDRCHLLIHQNARWHADTHILLRQRFLRLGATQFATLLKAEPKALRVRHARTRTHLTERTARQWYWCPTCKALPGEKCRGGATKRQRVHLARWEYAESERLRMRS